MGQQAPQNNLIVTSITTASNSKKEDTPRSIGPWTEHVTEDGKVFYFNKVNTLLIKSFFNFNLLIF
jgi:hypothetical protein